MEPAYTYITDTDGLKAALDKLQRSPIIALDTEASSFHRYHERICLVQLSDRESTFLLDPTTIADMSPLGDALADRRTEWVIHDADYDLRMLKKMWSFHVETVFDTMVSAELLNEPELGLAALLRKYYGLEVDKKYQKADWGKRPLSSPMLAYAAMDTAYLIGLRDHLDKALYASGRHGWAEEEFKALVRIPFDTPANDEPPFLRMKGAKALKPRQLAVLRELHAWREPIAERMDRAPFMVLGNDVLLDLARFPSTDPSELAKRKGIGDNNMERHGMALIAAVERGLALPKDELPRVPRPKRWDKDDDYEDRLKRLKTVRDELTAQRGMRSGMVFSNNQLSEIARLRPGDLEALRGIPGIRNWQAAEFGAPLLSAL